MSKEISKDLMCIVIRGGIEIWVDAEKLEAIQKQKEEKKSFILNGELINSADMVGVFKATTMEETNRRKNGQWKDEKGKWHNKGEVLCSRGCGNVIPWGMTCGNHGPK